MCSRISRRRLFAQTCLEPCLAQLPIACVSGFPVATYLRFLLGAGIPYIGETLYMGPLYGGPYPGDPLSELGTLPI